MTLQPGVSLSWVRTVLAQARRQGLTEAALLKAAGLSPAELALDRWPIDHITRLWRAAARLTQDPGFGLKTGTWVGPDSFNVVGFILQSAATVREALTLVQKYQPLISDGGRLQLLPGEQASWLIYHPQQGDLAFSPHQIEAVLAAVVSASRWIGAEGALMPQLVRLSHEAVGPLSGYRDVFPCPIEFGQAYSGLLLDNAALDQPLPQANALFARLHEQHAMEQLQALARHRGARQAVHDWLRTQLQLRAGPPVPTRAEAATALGLHERTLARRLEAQACTFQQLLDDVRRELALDWIDDPALPLKDLAHALGYADISPFYRAFQRWTGQTPAAWRARTRGP